MTARKAKSRFTLPELGERVGRRPARVADSIKEEIANLLLRKIKDPRVVAVAITAVSVTPDLRLARVYFSCERDAAEKVAAGLTSSKGFMRSHLAKQLGLRYVPELEFRYDQSVERQLEMEKILKEIAAEDDQASQ
jgi:ribosome-binding factor A